MHNDKGSEYTAKIFFFFYCRVDLRDLHSFPTRRSSDLSCEASQPGSRRSSVPALPTSIGPSGSRASRRPDRKSTRLNSSHMSISYAVFCLKKKKLNNAVIESWHSTLAFELRGLERFATT